MCDYLTELFNQGLSYSAVNTARSALSSYILPENGVVCGQNPYICRLLKGIFNRKPPKARYTYTWDPVNVLDHFKAESGSDITLKTLTLKLIILMALATMQRSQTLHFLNITTMNMGQDFVEFTMNRPLKHEKAGKSRRPLKIFASQDRDICVLTTLKDYLRRTQSLRKGQSQLFISYVKPHKAVTCDTIRRWLLTAMATAGINTHVFKAHSTRSAGTSAALRNGTPIKDILNSAQWSSSRTFEQFYNKPLIAS